MWDIDGRQEFVTLGALQRLQEMNTQDKDIAKLKEACVKQFPESVVEYYK